MKDRGRGSGRQPLGSPGAVRAGRREFGGGDDVGDLIKKVIIYVTASISRELRRKKGLPAYLNFPLKVTRRHSSSRHFVFSGKRRSNSSFPEKKEIFSTRFQYRLIVCFPRFSFLFFSFSSS